MNSVQQQQARARELVSYYLSRLMTVSRRENDHTPEQLLEAIQRVVSRGFANKGDSPKQIGRRAKKLAQQYKRTKFSQRDAAKLHKQFEHIDLNDYPHLVKSE